MNKNYHQVVKKLHFDMHTPENIVRVGEDLDIDKYIKSIKESNTQSVTIFARCGYGFTYFPTKIGVAHPNMKRDLFGELCKALRENDIDVTAYFSASHISTYEMERKNRLDWASKKDNGEYYLNARQDYKTYTPCPTGDFIWTQILPMILECATNYDINAIWIDGLYGYMNDICRCERCKETFLKEVPQAHGIMPSRAEYKWRTDIIWKFLDTVGAELKKINPELTVGADTIACTKWSIPKPEHVGFVTFDPQPDHLAFNIASSLSAISWRGVTSDMNIQRMRSWGHFNSRAPQNLCTESALCASMNSMLIAGDIVHSDTVQPDHEAMKNIATMFNFGEKIHNAVKDIPSYADIAILSSPENVRANISDWGVDEDFFGAVYQCVISAGLTAHVLFDDDLKDNLSRYKMLIVPELSYIGIEASKIIEEYVANGGKLLVTGNICGAVDPYATDDTADYSVFEKLCGVSSHSVLDTELSYLSLKDTPCDKYLKDIPLTSIAFDGCPTTASATTATVGANLYEHGMCYQYGALPIGDKTDFVGICENNYGKGKVTFIAVPIFRNYENLGDFMMKRLVHGIINENVTPYAILSGASNAQLIVAKGENTLATSVVVHHNDLRKIAPTVTDGIGKIAELKIKIAESRPIKSMTSVTGEEINFTQDGDTITIELPPVQIYAGVVIAF